jgi:DNA-directed RNA polymerase specialized sigma24 family protein
MTGAQDTTAVFEANRTRLVRIAYRMLGSFAEAEDVVQEAWIRWQGVDQSTVRQPAAFLVRTVTRLSLDVMKSARTRREAYVGNWLPEPVYEPEEEAPAQDELTLTLMMALERAAFLLHDVIAVPMDEIAGTLGRDAAAVRQLAVRARKHVQSARPRYPVAPEEGDRIAKAFFHATNNGDVASLRALLADGVILTADGGGKANAWLRPIIGLDRIVRLFSGLYRKLTLPPVLVRWSRIDSLPGYISYERDGTLQTTALEIEDGRITAVYITRNPDKLAKLGLPGSSSELH